MLRTAVLRVSSVLTGWFGRPQPELATPVALQAEPVRRVLRPLGHARRVAVAPRRARPYRPRLAVRVRSIW